MNSLLKRLVPGPVRNALREYRWRPAAVRWLPGDSGRFGPPRRWQHLREYFAAHSGQLREVLPAHPLVFPEATVIGELPPRFLETAHTTAPAGKVFTVRNSALLGPEGWVVAPPDTFLLDAGFEAHDSRKSVAEYHVFRACRGRAKPRRRLPGRCLSLASDYAVGGFGHFIHDSLSRLLLIERAELRLEEFDWVYLPRLKSLVVDQLVASLGVAPERLLNYDSTHDLECEELTATQFPGYPGYFSPPYADYLRHRFAPKPTRNDRRVYLSRRGFRRNFANAAAVEEILRARGFEELRADGDPATLRKCAEAAFVFSIEGANFFNALFCPRGTRVLLVFPDRLPHNLPFALSMAGAGGFSTYLVGGQTLGPPEIDGGIADFHLDPAKLERALDALGAV